MWIDGNLFAGVVAREGEPGKGQKKTLKMKI